LGVEEDMKKAMKYYEEAAELGSAQALFNLAGIYEEGEENVEQDFEKARKYYQEAINLGDSDALNGLGLMYQNGYFGKPDYQKASELFELSMKKENPDGYLSLAFLMENELGFCFIMLTLF
jgi:uncharacterized protein